MPTTPSEAMSSPLMGAVEKVRAVQFFAWINNWRESDPSTHSAGLIFKKKLNLKT